MNSVKRLKISKKLFLPIILLSLSFQSSFAQFVMGDANEIKEVTGPKNYVGVGTGINDIGLGGGSIEFSFVNKLAGYAHLGLGGWGYKVGLGLSYYFKTPLFGPAFNLGYTHSSGLKNFETDMETEPNDDIVPVIMDLRPAGTINATYSYSWTLGQKGKFSFLAGYAFSTTSTFESYKVISPGILLNNTSMQILETLKPGGLVLGVRVMFGLN